MADTEFDLVVIGSGPAGYIGAIRGAQLGLKTAIVEKWETLGGTCLNIGCIPSKALLDSSEHYATARRGLEAHGISVGEVALDLAKMLKRKDKVVKKLTGGVAGLMKANKVNVFRGTGSVPEPHTVRIEGADETKLSAKSIMLATGSVPVELPFLPFDGTDVVSSTEALSFSEVPKRLIVVGAGAIGLEMGSVWSRLGSEVTVVELLSGAIPGWDAGLSKTLRKELTKQGVNFSFETKVTGFERGKKGVLLKAQDKSGKEVSFEGDKILVAVGRRPYTEGLGLEKLGVAMDGPRVKVNEGYRTNVEGLYAVGDIITGAMLAHKAEDEAVACAELIAGKPGHVNYAAIPNVVYTWPEVASVGKTEEQLKDEGIAYSKGQFNFSANGRSLAMEDTPGFVKILGDERTGKLLGAHIIGPWASDLIPEAVTIMEFGGSVEDMGRACHAHPTLAEAVKEAALSAAGWGLNSV